MATYLDRSICPWQINSASPHETSFEYETESRQVGEGAERAIGTQTWTVRKTDATATIAGGLDEIGDFMAEASGRARGFWIAFPSATADILAVEGDDLLCAGAELASRWGLTPRTHVMLTDGRRNQYATEATAATASDGDTLLTLSDMPEGVDETWTIALLQYVRFADDKLEFSEVSPETYTVDFSVVEIPLEYETAQTPTATVYLYELGYIIGDVENMSRYTNAGQSILGTDGTIWTARAIDHGDINRDMEGADTRLSALTTDWPDCPLLDMFPRAGGLPLAVRIHQSQIDLDTLNETGERIELFDGQVFAPAREGPEITCKCKSGSDLFTRELPTFTFTRLCQVPFCSTACGLSRANYEMQATYQGAVELDGNYYIDVLCAGLTPRGGTWLTLGEVVTPDCRSNTPSKYWERRPVLGVTSLGSNQFRVQVRHPFARLEADQTVYLYRGCMRTPTACKAQITSGGASVNNYANYKGHPHVPISNPQTNLDTTATTGKKGGK